MSTSADTYEAGTFEFHTSFMNDLIETARDKFKSGHDIIQVACDSHKTKLLEETTTRIKYFNIR